jgi:putative integral membrane protein (TIGR02587 family)
MSRANSPARKKQKSSSPWKKELDDFVRAISSTFLFGIPLLYTLEMWQIGSVADLWKLVLFLVLALGVNTILVHFSGFKQESTFHNSLAQAVEAVAIGVVASVTLLLILNRIRSGESLDSMLGKVIIQAAPLSLGASIANAIFSSWRSREWEDEPSVPHDPWHVLLNDVAATLTGGLFIGLAIAPTDEVTLLAAGMSLWHQIALISFSLLITYTIVFAGEFSPHLRGPAIPFQLPFTETVLAYSISLLVALATLYLFHQIEWGDSLRQIISHILVLGLPVAIGGAAGRLVL